MKMSPKLIRKECIRLGLVGRFTMKEDLVELATSLVRNNLDPKTYHFYPSQPLKGYFPYQVVISTEMVETMKMLFSPNHFHYILINSLFISLLRSDF